MSASPVAALWRLHPYLRPYRFRLALLLLAAIAATGTEIVIPLIAKVVIDGAIAHQFLHKVKETLENWSEPLL